MWSGLMGAKLPPLKYFLLKFAFALLIKICIFENNPKSNSINWIDFLSLEIFLLFSWHFYCSIGRVQSFSKGKKLNKVVTSRPFCGKMKVFGPSLLLRLLFDWSQRLDVVKRVLSTMQLKGLPFERLREETHSTSDQVCIMFLSVHSDFL